MQTEQTVATTDDFSAFFLQDEARIEIDLPSDQPMLYQGNRVAVIVHGPSTREWAQAAAAKNKAAHALAMITLGKKTNHADNPPPDEDRIDADFLATITKHIENFPYPGGKTAIYTEPRLKYINLQVERFANRLGNFFKAGDPS